MPVRFRERQADFIMIQETLQFSKIYSGDMVFINDITVMYPQEIVRQDRFKRF